MGLASILDHVETVALRNFNDRIHVSRLPKQMYWNDGFCSRGNSPFELSRIQGIRLLINIHKDGLCATKADRLSSRHERHWDGYDFVSWANPQRE